MLTIGVSVLLLTAQEFTGITLFLEIRNKFEKMFVISTEITNTR